MEGNIWNLWHIEQKISEQIIHFLIKDPNELERKQYLLLKLGVDSFVNNFFKLLIIYSCALLFGIGIQTFILHLSFLVIRTFSYGYHSSNSFLCILSSLFFFVGCVLILPMNSSVPLAILFLIQGINGRIILYFAPIVTTNNPIGSERKKNRRKWQAFTACVLLTISLFFIDQSIIRNLIVLGNILACFTLLPVMHWINQRMEDLL